MSCSVRAYSIGGRVLVGAGLALVLLLGSAWVELEEVGSEGECESACACSLSCLCWLRRFRRSHGRIRSILDSYRVIYDVAGGASLVRIILQI